MKVQVDQDKCISSGNCVMHASEVFDQRVEDGVAFLLTENPAAERMNALRWAVLPTQNSTSGGSSDSDVNAFAVIALTASSASVAMTVTPVTN